MPKHDERIETLGGLFPMMPDGSNAIATHTDARFPKNMTEEQWAEAGREIGRVRGTLNWWIGDWWAFGEDQGYGNRKAIVESEDWEGPAFQTCANAATVCRAFETSSREEVVSFRFHQAIAVIPDEAMRLEVLSWTAKTQPTFKQLEAKVKEARQFLSQGWTPDQLERKARAEAGECVVASIADGGNGRRVDEALLTWAEANDAYVRIDRQTPYGNPFEMPDDGDRETVCRLFAEHYWPFKPKLQQKARSTFKGKVLGCWCHPQQCHGHFIAEFVNEGR